MNYRIFGPHELGRTTNKKGTQVLELNKEAQAMFWEEVKKIRARPEWSLWLLRVRTSRSKSIQAMVCRAVHRLIRR